MPDKLLSLPDLPIKFKPGRIAQEKIESFDIIPVFSDQPESSIATHIIAKNITAKQLDSFLKQFKEKGIFTGKNGEILNQIQNGYILCGLGKKDLFHPDKCGAVFRKVAKSMVKYSNFNSNVVLTDEVEEAANRFSEQGKLSGAIIKSPPMHSSDRTEKRKKNSDLNDQEKDDIQVDYFAPLTLAELVSQIISSMIIGFDSMNILQKERGQKKKKTWFSGIIVSGLTHNELLKAIHRGEESGRMINGVRYIVSLPGNIFNPDAFEDYSTKLSRKYKLKQRVLNQEKLKELGCRGILMVGQGSASSPRMITLEYNPVKKHSDECVLLVGKGITFDTGGISLKPAGDMHKMKYDMAGAALVIHGVALAAAQKIPIRVIGLIGIAENMPGGRSVRPGDVYEAYNGLSVEVQNTDAEGRLILADLLAFAAEELQPTCMLDFATLTGACVIALGHEAAGVMTASEALASRIEQASRKSLDRTWRLPHWHQYGEELKSDIADLRNIGSRAAGTISAMRFLARFVPTSIPWAHIDIAGTAWRKKEGGILCSGATGWGIKLINQFLEDISHV